MTIQDCLTQMRAIKDAAFATVDENGRPQVRIIDIMLIADDTIIFCTARGKNFYRELLRDGHVAVTCLSKDWKMLRLNGVAQRLDDQHTWIDRIFAANPSMNDVYPGDARYVLEALHRARGAGMFRSRRATDSARKFFHRQWSDRTEGLRHQRPLHRLRQLPARLPPASDQHRHAIRHCSGTLPALRPLCRNLSGWRH